MKPSTKTPGFWVRLRPELRAWIRRQAPQEGRSQSNLVETLVLEAVAARGVRSLVEDMAPPEPEPFDDIA